MKPVIPIKNIYYLLSYAWNKLEESEMIDVDCNDSNELVDLFARILIGGVKHVFKRGLDRGYVEYHDESRVLRGKIDFVSCTKRQLLRQGKIACTYDEMTHDILHNQILKSTMLALIYTKDLAKELKDELTGLFRKFHDISDIKIDKRCFQNIQLHSNNSYYGFLLKVCEMIYECLLPDESSGKNIFQDFFRDERKMAYLFEEFVRNFYYHEQSEYRVKREHIKWDFAQITEGENLLPTMKTDISLNSDEKKIIIDTKFYKQTLQKNYDKESIHSGNIYQILAYVNNIKGSEKKDKHYEGILLYPTIEKEIENFHGRHNEKIGIATVNLDQDWKGIHDRLLSLIGISE